jgi:hypothetical protein
LVVGPQKNLKINRPEVVSCLLSNNVLTLLGTANFTKNLEMDAQLLLLFVHRRFPEMIFIAGWKLALKCNSM